MAIQIENAIHAMCVVDGAGVFVGQGNVGFAPFGTGDPELSEHVGLGQNRLRLLQPVAILRNGEGLVIVTPYQIGPPTFPLFNIQHEVKVDDTGFNILVQTQSNGASFNGFFQVLVLRFPQQSTTE